jgi:GTP 3',8-cyclase
MMQDLFHRRITYIRLSVTDRCNFRCVYCMSEKMQFLPRQAVLSLEELYEVACTFVSLGVTKIRITGGEPLVRNGLIDWIKQVRQIEGLETLALTTNGALLTDCAAALKEAGLNSLNVSLDSLEEARFQRITRTGSLLPVLAGIDAALAVGFPVKINVVVMRGYNDDEILNLVAFALEKKIDCTFIEEMPLGTITEHDRGLSFLSNDEVLKKIQAYYPFEPIHYSSGGPARYYQMVGSPVKVGFISPHSHNFCSTCNRVRVTAEGRLLLCLANEEGIDLREILRAPSYQRPALQQAIMGAMAIKPKEHAFNLWAAEPQIVRFMNMTGG